MSFEPINVFDYEARAEQVLHKDHWDFIDAGDFDELTVRRNRTAFNAISLRPKFHAGRAEPGPFDHPPRP